MNNFGIVLGSAWLTSCVTLFIIVRFEMKREKRMDKYMSHIENKLDEMLNIYLDKPLETQLSVLTKTDMLYGISLLSIDCKRDKEYFKDIHGIRLKYMIYNNIIDHPNCLIKLHKKEYIEQDI